MNHKSVMEILEKRFGDKAWSYNNQLLLLGKINDTEHKLHEERIHIEIDQALSDLKQLIPSEEEIMRLVYLQLCLELPKNIGCPSCDVFFVYSGAFVYFILFFGLARINRTPLHDFFLSNM